MNPNLQGPGCDPGQASGTEVHWHRDLVASLVVFLVALPLRGDRSGVGRPGDRGPALRRDRRSRGRRPVRESLAGERAGGRAGRHGPRVRPALRPRVPRTHRRRRRPHAARGWTPGSGAVVPRRLPPGCPRAPGGNRRPGDGSQLRIALGSPPTGSGLRDLVALPDLARQAYRQGMADPKGQAAAVAMAMVTVGLVVLADRLRAPLPPLAARGRGRDLLRLVGRVLPRPHPAPREPARRDSLARSGLVPEPLRAPAGVGHAA